MPATLPFPMTIKLDGPVGYDLRQVEEIRLYDPKSQTADLSQLSAASPDTWSQVTSSGIINTDSDSREDD